VLMQIKDGKMAREPATLKRGNLAEFQLTQSREKWSVLSRTWFICCKSTEAEWLWAILRVQPFQYCKELN
jgi:hypothetical protein